MKPTKFFLEKSESLIIKLNSIELVELNLNWDKPKDIYGEINDSSSANFYSQKEELSEIRFQIKLMFSEFDKGVLFSERLDNFTSNAFLSNEPLKNSLVENLQLFIDFLKEYRV